jgi:hypothetical protein
VQGVTCSGRMILAAAQDRVCQTGTPCEIRSQSYTCCKMETGCSLCKRKQQRVVRQLSSAQPVYGCQTVIARACVLLGSAVLLRAGVVICPQKAGCTCSMHTVSARPHMRACGTSGAVERPAVASPLQFRSVRQLCATDLRQLRGPIRQRCATGRQPFVTRATSSTDSRHVVYWLISSGAGHGMHAAFTSSLQHADAAVKLPALECYPSCSSCGCLLRFWQLFHDLVQSMYVRAAQQVLGKATLHSAQE